MGDWLWKFPNWLFHMAFIGFKEVMVLILRNLPFSNFKRFIFLAVVYALLIVLESIVFFRLWPEGLGVLFLSQSLFFGFSIILLLHNFLYLRPDQNKTFAWIVFWRIC